LVNINVKGGRGMATQNQWHNLNPTKAAIEFVILSFN
jgi:hypothetical protein